MHDLFTVVTVLFLSIIIGADSVICFSMAHGVLNDREDTVARRMFYFLSVMCGSMCLVGTVLALITALMGKQWLRG